MGRKLLSVVAPVFNEELCVEEFYRRTSEALKELKQSEGLEYEIVLVNDGSKDRTYEILKGFAAKDRKLKLIDLSRNFGHQSALTCGYEQCKGDIIVSMDSDLQDPPEEIKNLVAEYNKGYDIVFAKRKSRRGETEFKLRSAEYFYKFLNFMTGKELPENVGDFRLITKQVKEEFLKYGVKKYIRGIIADMGFKQSFIEYARDKRFAGVTKFSLVKMLKFAFDAIFTFSDKLSYVFIVTIGALLIPILISFLLIFIGKAFGIHLAPVRFVLFIFGFVFFISSIFVGISILIEYAQRIYSELQKKPIYIVREKINL